MIRAHSARRRRSIRLRGYDYSQLGMYFITVCTRGRAPLLGDVTDGKMRLNDAGEMVLAVWQELPAHYLGLEMDACVVMPNHFHGIIVLPGAEIDSGLVGAGFKPAPANRRALPEIIRGFKAFSARRINELHKTSGPIWQRSYYEHIIRHGESLDRIRRYIFENPAHWEFDPENPQATGPAPEEPWARR
jgi:REP-associated tyrosine transposase